MSGRSSGKRGLFIAVALTAAAGWAGPASAAVALGGWVDAAKDLATPASVADVASRFVPLPVQQAMVDGGAVAAARLVYFGGVCVAETGVVMRPEGTRSPWAPRVWAVAASERLTNEPGNVVCDRALANSFATLAKDPQLAKSVALTIKEGNSEATLSAMSQPRDPNGIAWAHNGIGRADLDWLSQQMPASFGALYDTRLFQVEVNLYPGIRLDTGRWLCLAVGGLTANTDVRHRLTPYVFGGISPVRGPAAKGSCAREALSEFARSVGSDPLLAYTAFARVAVPGVLYPSVDKLRRVSLLLDKQAGGVDPPRAPASVAAGAPDGRWARNP